MNTKKRISKLLAAILTLAMTLALMPGGMISPQTASAVPVPYTGNPVTTFEELQAAITAFNEGSDNMEITIGDDFKLTGTLTVSNADCKLTITSDTTRRTLTRGISGNLFSITGSATNPARLILENIIIDGDRYGAFDNTQGSLVYVGGVLDMESGAVLRNSSSGNADVGSCLHIHLGTFNFLGHQNRPRVP